MSEQKHLSKNVEIRMAQSRIDDKKSLNPNNNGYSPN
jgi:hypothetical protein